MKTITAVITITLLSLFICGASIAVDRHDLVSRKKQMPASNYHLNRIIRHLPAKPFHVEVKSADGVRDLNVNYSGGILRVYGSVGPSVSASRDFEFNAATGAIVEKIYSMTFTYYKVGDVYRLEKKVGGSVSSDTAITYSEYKTEKDKMHSLVEAMTADAKTGGIVDGKVQDLKKAEKILK